MPEFSIFEISCQCFGLRVHQPEGGCEHPLRLQGCAHMDTREIQGASLPLRNAQACRPGIANLFSVKGQIDVIGNEGHVVCVPLCVKQL